MPTFIGHNAREELISASAWLGLLGQCTPRTVQFIILGQLYECPQVIFPVFQEPLDVILGACHQEHTRECEHLTNTGKGVR
jgi:hypothetical protein